MGGGTTPPPIEVPPALQTPAPVTDECRDAMAAFGAVPAEDTVALNDAGLAITDSCAGWTEFMAVVSENPTAVGYATAEEVDEKALAKRVCAEARMDTPFCMSVERVGLLSE